MMAANSSHANQRNQSQERPSWKAATDGRNLAAVADASIDAVLLKDLHITLGPLWRNFGSRDKRRSNTVSALGHCRSRQLRIDRRRRSHIGRRVLRACLSSGILKG